MHQASIERWRAACEALGIHDYDAEYRKLRRVWNGWGRRYHTLGHLDACLRELSDVKALAERPAEVELALWFHDAVYRTYRSDNELRSAEWAVRFMQSHGSTPDAASRVRALILATAHNASDLNGDTALTVDVDLSILGQPRNIYDVFERNVRGEYWWVRKHRYVTARSQILKSFLDRTAIYHWPEMRDKYETQARENLRYAIEQLAKR